MYGLKKDKYKAAQFSAAAANDYQKDTGNRIANYFCGLVRQVACAGEKIRHTKPLLEPATINRYLNLPH